MVASLRHILLILLVLLQIAAPLVHAHVGGDGGVSGLHLHTFQARHGGHDVAASLSETQQVGAILAIVELDTAIRLQPGDDDCPAAVVADDGFRVFPLYRAVGRINFSPHDLPSVTGPFLSFHTSRAPPV